MSDKTINKVVGLHESTVKNAEAHAEAFAPPRRRRATVSSRTFEVDHMVVDRLAWKAAMRLAGGDGSRIEIVDELTVIVH